MVIANNKYMMIGAAVAGLALAYMMTRGAGKAVEAVKDAAQAINPLNNDNIINKGFTSIYQGVTGSEGTLGGDFYDATHGGMLDGIVNPTSNNNIINRGVSGVGSAVTGDSSWTLGGQIYDWMH